MGQQGMEVRISVSGKLVAVFLGMRRLTNYPKIFSMFNIILFKIRNGLFSRSKAIHRFRFEPVNSFLGANIWKCF